MNVVQMILFTMWRCNWFIVSFIQTEKIRFGKYCGFEYI